MQRDKLGDNVLCCNIGELTASGTCSKIVELCQNPEVDAVLQSIEQSRFQICLKAGGPEDKRGVGI